MRICLILKRLPSLRSSCYRVFGNKSYYYQIIGGVWGLNRFWTWTGPYELVLIGQVQGSVKLLNRTIGPVQSSPNSSLNLTKPDWNITNMESNFLAILWQLKCDSAKEELCWFVVIFAPWEEEAGAKRPATICFLCYCPRNHWLSDTG